ncbi:hypothetical protein JDV02_010869 [Purpureocillium takamizusanense]|uniref:Uncharacterized protein n=1 Tax=Purpureocillium takamizusanense TaxID=2060973 RepID=A0A9Q8QLM3_9HYPO|nr:uncharacterized protein JDV02_010869 [Purpureocillium takamizusanense]UNI21885.1 hypothetical protein JDV02_010869 [Purpureocillium takamizusanense]
MSAHETEGTAPMAHACYSTHIWCRWRASRLGRVKQDLELSVMVHVWNRELRTFGDMRSASHIGARGDGLAMSGRHSMTRRASGRVDMYLVEGPALALHVARRGRGRRSTCQRTKQATDLVSGTGHFWSSSTQTNSR